jgi:nucleoside 2-deoxyribosyltransferase
VTRKRIYLAAPLFNERELSFNLAFAQRLEVHFDVFLPQRDGLLLARLLDEGVPIEAAEMLIFERDRSALEHCDLLVAVLDGAHIDEGVAFEIGFANARRAPCVGLQSDVRRALPSGNNPMIGRALSAVFSDVDALVAFLETEPATIATSTNKGDQILARQAAVDMSTKR